jgi:hypothetical protein
VGLGGIVFALIQSVAIAGVIGAFALVGFLCCETRYASWFHSDCRGPGISPGANLLTLFLYSALGEVLVFFPLNLIGAGLFAIGGGATRFSVQTLTPKGATSIARASLKPPTAHLAA